MGGMKKKEYEKTPLRFLRHQALCARVTFSAYFRLQLPLQCTTPLHYSAQECVCVCESSALQHHQAPHGVVCIITGASSLTGLMNGRQWGWMEQRERATQRVVCTPMCVREAKQQQKSAHRERECAACVMVCVGGAIAHASTSCNVSGAQ